MTAPLPELGFIGVGAMGGPMARNLLKAGWRIRAYDTNPRHLQNLCQAGAVAATSSLDALRGREFVLLSLPDSESFVKVAEELLIPHCSIGQVFIDLGTTTPPETRRIYDLLARRQANLVDAPVSGGVEGAQKAGLRMFVGGADNIITRCLPILQTLTAADHIHDCGPSGSGQVVKGVNQLMMALATAAYMEAVGFGVRAGVAPHLIEAAVGGQGWLRGDFAGIAHRITQGDGDELGVKFRELPYFLQEAAHGGFSLPLTQSLFNFCNAGPRVAEDDNRPAPSFWHELMRYRKPADGESD